MLLYRQAGHVHGDAGSKVFLFCKRSGMVVVHGAASALLLLSITVAAAATPAGRDLPGAVASRAPAGGSPPFARVISARAGPALRRWGAIVVVLVPTPQVSRCSNVQLPVWVNRSG